MNFHLQFSSSGQTQKVLMESLYRVYYIQRLKQIFHTSVFTVLILTFVTQTIPGQLQDQ